MTIDQYGNRTATWEWLRRINLEIAALAPTALKLRSIGVFHYPDVPDQAKPPPASKLERSIEMTQHFVKRPAAGTIPGGEFEGGHRRAPVMIINRAAATAFSFAHLLEEDAKLIRISPYTGKEEAFGCEMDWLAPGRCPAGDRGVAPTCHRVRRESVAPNLRITRTAKPVSMSVRKSWH